ncbi:NADPH-dependent oxidoreductase [uncultured Bacteroides sp.]|uniref:NADPH-dependent oxidoreductase n=1 Tax=uncultured Bacteroides sp. TaxID=162156 RepID=UPI002AA8D937|nr:NADPH-dependent oxidoreductase [uncultured Bacteroides sp.]
MIESIKKRKTIRKYLQKEIPDALLNDMLTTSFRASTVGNMQVYSVIVTRDVEMKAKLSPAHYNQPMINNAPVILTFCADFQRFSQWCTERKATPAYDNFQSFMNAAIDALLVAQTFCTVAEEKGLGICYLGTTTYNPQMIIDTLKLPKLVFPVTTITLGYPDEQPEQVDRLPFEAIIHKEYYHNYTSADINKWYAYKESLAENKRFTEESQKETLAQVFTDIRYTKKDNEFTSQSLLQALRRQGFLD